MEGLLSQGLPCLVNRPRVAGAVLQIPLSFINWLRYIFTAFIRQQKIFIAFQGKTGHQFLILKPQCFLQLSSGYSFDYDVEIVNVN